MKRTIAILAGLAAFGVAAYVSSRAAAQQGGGYQQQMAQTQQVAMRPPQTRIALINLGQVFKNYQKFKNFEEQFKSDQLWYQKELDKKKTQLQQLSTDMAKTADQAARDQMEKQVKQLQREMQDLADDGKTRLSKREFDMLVQTYREIQDAVSRYARAQDLDLILHYNDGIGADAYSPAIFPRKLANGACQPMYIAAGMDITGAVTEMLNRNMGQSIQPAGAYQQPNR